MISKKTIAAAAIALGALSAAPANAGNLNFHFGFGPGFGWNHHQHSHVQRLSGPQVRQILRHKGYRQINFVDRGGSTYEVLARKHNRTFYLVVSARTGQILHARRA